MSMGTIQLRRQEYDALMNSFISIVPRSFVCMREWRSSLLERIGESISCMPNPTSTFRTMSVVRSMALTSPTV